MARPLRIEFPGAWYHVMNRGLARCNIFRCHDDRRFFLGLLGEISEIFNVQIHAYSLMDNHYHLLVHTPELGLSRAMRHLNGLYTQTVNKRWKSDGPIFRGRYRALLVDSEQYLLELVRYIHLNPVEAGLTTEPAGHDWTSHGAYLAKNKRTDWLWTAEVLGRFGQVEKRAIKEMDQFVKAGISKNFREELKKSSVIIGTKGFTEWVYRNFADGKKEGIALKERRPQIKVKAGQVLDHVKLAYNISISELRRGQSGVRNEGREMAVYLARRICGLKQRDIAKWLGFRDANAVAQIQYRFQRRLEKNRKLTKRMRVIQNSILNNVKT